MHVTKTKVMTLWTIIILVLPSASMPFASAWEAGDEAAVFDHTFSEEYWTNDSIIVSNNNGTASFTASYVHVGEFQAFMIAFNNANMSTGQHLISPYQLFGMHYKTPQNRDVFVGATFAFLLLHNESYGSNSLPDMGHEAAWYIVPFNDDTTFGVKPSVVPIPATKVSNRHYRFGMSYYNLTCRIVEAGTPTGFWLSLALPVLTVLLSELTIEYDIVIHDDGSVQAESLYTIGQIHQMKVFGLPVAPSDIIVDSMKISVVHYLSVFASQYRVINASTGNTITAPNSTTPIDDDIGIVVGPSERAFDIGFDHQYSLKNETTDPWDVVSINETTMNCLLGVRLSDLVFVAWQSPLSAPLFAHMTFGLSEHVRNIYSSVGDLTQGTLNGTAFVNSNWWYAVTFPEWHGLRVQQDPVYMAYTSLSYAPNNPTNTTTTISTTTTTTSATDNGSGSIVVLLMITVGVIVIVLLIRRQS